MIDSKVYGGEGGIRTPDTLTSMPDFESGAFNRALPPLPFVYSNLRGFLIVPFGHYDANYEVNRCERPSTHHHAPCSGADIVPGG